MIRAKLSRKGALRSLKYAAISLALGSSVAVADALIPGDGKKLLIIGQDTDSIDNYVAATGIAPGGVTGYINLSDLGGLTTDVDNGGGNNNAGRLFANYPQSTLAIAVYLVGQLDGINNGTYDGQINQLVSTLVAWERPIYLRWGYEFDGAWNSYDSAAFISAWQRMHNALDAAGADNVTMVWQSSSYCGGTYQNKPFTDWYPGDDYVDMVGLSYFTPQDCNGSEVNKIVTFARAKALPVMIAESAPQRYDIGQLTYNPQVQRQVPDQSKTADEIWNEWFANYFNFIDTNSDVVKIAAYINADWDSQALWASPYPQGYWGDSRVEVNATIQSNWVTEIQGSDWLNASPNLFSELGSGGGPGPGPGEDTDAPTVPVGLSGAIQSSTGISLTWGASTDNVAVTEYNLYRDGTLYVTLPGTSYQDSGLDADTTYSYAVSACDASGNCSALSAPVSLTTDSGPSNSGNGGFAFGIEADGTLYHYDGGQSGSWNYLCIDSACTPGTLVDGRWERETGITSGTHFIEFKIQDNATGQCIFSASDVTPGSGVTTSNCTDYVGDGSNNPPPDDTESPTTPSGLSGAIQNSTSINLSWGVSNDNVSVTEYNLYRDGTLYVTLPGTSYVDSGLTADTTYSYTVNACDAAGNCSAQSAPVSLTTDSEPVSGGNGGFAFGIEADGTLYHYDGGQSGSWNYLCIDSACTPGTLVNGRWERETGITSGTHFIEFKIQDNATGQCIFSASDVAVGSGVTASNCTDYVGDGSNNPPPDDTESPTTPSGLAGSVQNETNITLTWSASSDNVAVTSYLLYRDGIAYTSILGTSYLDTGLAEGTTYSYAVSACDAADNCSAQSTPISVTTDSDNPPPVDTEAPTVPAGLAGSQQNGSLINLNWQPATDNVAVTQYNVYRDGSLLTSVAGSAFTDTSVTESTTYLYSVSACDAANNCSTQSADVAVTTGVSSGQCSVVEDPGAETGEGFEAGLTTSGVAYYREQSGAQRGFAIWGLQGSAPNLSGQQVLFTDSANNSYYRYEIDLGSLDADTRYTLEMRLQGDEFAGGQCIQTLDLKPGEGVTDAACYNASSGGSENPIEAPTPLTVGMKVTDAQNGKARLTSGETTNKVGYALYTFDLDTENLSNCSGGCENNWPKLIIDSPDALKTAGGITGSFGTIARTYEGTDDCGNSTTITDYQVTYNGQPLYFYAGDTSPDTTSGAGLPNWRLAEADLIPQLPLVKHPSPALRAAINGLEPSNFGFAVDIDGRTVTWRPSGYNNNQAGLIVQFSPYGGEGQPVQAKDPNLELWCSNNQIQFHKANMPGTRTGPYTAEFPASCYGEFYYFFRYRIFGTVNLEPEDNWVYTALFVYDENDPTNRVDPRSRPTVTYTSANWMRHGHPHSRDRPEEFITFDAMPYNTSLLSGLERYTTTVVDGPNNFNIQPNTNGSLLRIEAFEWGAGNCQGPQYMINENPIGSDRFDYGQIISWEATFGSAQNNFPGGTSISSQVYNTMQNNTIGMGFTSATGDPRLNLAGPAGVRMVHSNGCNPVEADERNARFTQQLTTVQSASKVDDFIKGHNAFHGMAEVSQSKPGSTGFAGGNAIRDVSGAEQVPAGLSSCGSCHFRDGRSEFVVQTDKGPRLAPPTFGVGLLEWIQGAETGLTWDGSVPSVEAQSLSALDKDLGLTPAEIGEEIFDQIVVYTETLHVPVRDYKTYADPDVADGEALFHEANCQSCHQVTQKTRSDAPVEFRNLVIRPYTDMKTWNVNGGEFRTAPLWAIGQNIELLERNGMQTLFMHDGSATSLDGAIQKHTEDGQASRDAYNALTASERDKLIKFLRSL